jgi:hypothetical protein
MADDSGMDGGGRHGRVGGSGFTYFKYRSAVVAFAQALTIQSPAPVADAVAVQPLNYRRPAESSHHERLAPARSLLQAMKSGMHLFGIS